MLGNSLLPKAYKAEYTRPKRLLAFNYVEYLQILHFTPCNLAVTLEIQHSQQIHIVQLLVNICGPISSISCSSNSETPSINPNYERVRFVTMHCN